MLSKRSEDILWTNVERVCADVLEEQSGTASRLTSLLENTSEVGEASYRQGIQDAVRNAAPAFLPDGAVSQCSVALATTDKALQAIEEELESLVEALEKSHEGVSDSLRCLRSLQNELDATQIVTSHVSTFVEQVRIRKDVESAVHEAGHHSDEFRDALAFLSKITAFLDRDEYRDAPSCINARPVVRKLTSTSLIRITERLNESFNLLGVPSTSFEILRSSLLQKQNHLITFVAEHDRSLFKHVMQEYASISANVLSSELEAYCLLLSSRSTRVSDDDGRYDLSSLAQGTAKMVAAMLLETLTVKEQAQDIHSSYSCRAHISLRSCIAALQSTAEPLTCAEIQLQGDSFNPTIVEVFRNCSLYFLKQVEMEQRFVKGVFGDEEGSLLDEIFSTDGAPIICLLQREFSLWAKQPLFIEDLATTLFVCRRLRNGIATHRTLDHRILYLVRAEKELQTTFLRDLDLQVSAVNNKGRSRISSTHAEDGFCVWFQNSCSLLTNLLSIILESYGHVEAGDIRSTIYRRLQAFVDNMRSTAELSVSDLREQTAKSRVLLRCCIHLLTACDVPGDETIRAQEYRDLRSGVKQNFKSKCDEYAKIIASKFTQELHAVSSVITKSNVQTTREWLRCFHGDWMNRVEAIAKCFVFEANPQSEEYVRHARNKALQMLIDKNDVVASLVREHCPSEAHLVVSKTALTHAVRELAGFESAKTQTASVMKEKTPKDRAGWLRSK